MTDKHSRTITNLLLLVHQSTNTDVLKHRAMLLTIFGDDGTPSESQLVPMAQSYQVVSALIILTKSY